MTVRVDPKELGYTKKDFTSDQDVRWCPGCGDYSILAQMQKVMPELGIPRENVVFISGIGCSSRFPYYMNTFGFHTIHGRALSVATGLKLARPELSVWVVTGDGDSLSIGTNHLVHALRRNIDVNVLLFNNKVYGLTKGQFSPTSDLGQITKSSPSGVAAPPFSAAYLALGAQASFVARSLDTDLKHLQQMIHRMADHEGTSFLEIFQNCPVFNDGVFSLLTDKADRADHVLTLEQGQPLVYGKSRDRVLKLDVRTQSLYAASVGETDDGIEILHDEHARSPMLASLLAQEPVPGLPVAIGVLRDIEKPIFEREVRRQRQKQVDAKGAGTLAELLEAGDRWDL